MTDDAAQGDSPQPQDTNNTYSCPYCGFNISPLDTYCPNCGGGIK